MKIKNEFQLIKTLTKNFKIYHHDLKVGIGDDTAVIKNGKKYFLLTCDCLVENDHFNCAWATPKQIGRKAVEVNVSDIAAAGGLPKYMLVSIVLTKDTREKWVKDVYTGMKEICDKYKITLAGGDTTHGPIKMLDIFLLGETKKPILRSNAKTNDLICVTGQVGGSTAGLKLFRQNKKVPIILRQKHLEPKARLDVSHIIAKYANSMIDVSDGIGSEVRHICEESKKGAIIYAEKIPLCPGATLKDALSGGEDFELLFTINKNKLKKLKNIDYTVIGEIKNKKYGIWLMKNFNKLLMPKGYDHFTNNP